MEIRERIAEIIEREGMTQADFSRVTGIKTSTLSHMLTGRNRVSHEVLNKILVAFPRYRKEWIVDGSGEMLLSDEELKHLEQGQLSSNKIIHPLFQFETSSVDATPSAIDSRQRSSKKQQHSVAPKVSKIIIYFEDNTFQTFTPSESE